MLVNVSVTWCNSVVMIVSSDELVSIQTVYIEHVHSYSDSWPVGSIFLVCISHALSMYICIYVDVQEHTVIILIWCILVNN